MIDGVSKDDWRTWRVPALLAQESDMQGEK
jgi:hypothetical protein